MAAYNAGSETQPTRDDGIEVYHTVRREERRCEYGDKHHVEVYESTTIYPTDRTWAMDNGYEKRQEEVWEDTEGNEYRRMVTIDYSNNIYYLADTGHWLPRPPFRGVPDA